MVIRIALILSFFISLIAQRTFAATSGMTRNQSIASVLKRIPDLRTGVTMARFFVPGEEVDRVFKKLDEKRVDLNAPFGFRENDGHYFFGADEIVLLDKGVLFRGQTFTYDFSKDYDANFDMIAKRLSQRKNAFDFSHLIFGTAAAVTDEERLKQLSHDENVILAQSVGIVGVSAYISAHFPVFIPTGIYIGYKSVKRLDPINNEMAEIRKREFRVSSMSCNDRKITIDQKENEPKVRVFLSKNGTEVTYELEDPKTFKKTRIRAIDQSKESFLNFYNGCMDGFKEKNLIDLGKEYFAKAKASFVSGVKAAGEGTTSK